MAEDNNIIGSVGKPMQESATHGALEQQVGLAARPSTYVPGTDYAQVSKTPSHMILMDDMLGSTVSDFEDHAILYDFTLTQSKVTNPDQGGPLYSSSQVTASDVEVVIPHGPHLTVLLDRLHKSIPIAQTTFVTLANISETNVHMLDLNFYNCYLQRITPNKEKVVMTFKYAAFDTEVFEYSQDGQLLGQTVYAKDFTTGLSE
ncbi:MAG: hypothetical protein GY915_02815 [bacterium]|nr:hypothetical protein [bacterium]